MNDEVERTKMNLNDNLPSRSMDVLNVYGHDGHNGRSQLSNDEISKLSEKPKHQSSNQHNNHIIILQHDRTNLKNSKISVSLYGAEVWVCHLLLSREGAYVPNLRFV